MAFELIERWTQSHAAGGVIPSWLMENRLSRNLISALASIAGAVGIVYLLIGLDTVTSSAPHHSDNAIMVFYVVSSSQIQSAPSIAEQPVSPSTEVEVTNTSPVPAEWSVVSLPPAPLPPPPTLLKSAAATSAAAAAGTAAPGTGSTGEGTGSGYDPYAFASYQVPDPARLIASQRKARLEDAIHGILGRRRIDLNVRLTFDQAGNVVAATIISGLSGPDREKAVAAVIGVPVAAPDPSRPLNDSVTVTLTI